MFNEILISRANLINNIEQAKRNNPNSKICVMVKANAYGVGMSQVVNIIDRYVDYYGVACFFEAEALRHITNKEILIVGALENIEECAKLNIQVSIHSMDDAKRIKELNKPIKVHIKLNTGMNRYGIKSKRELNSILKLLYDSQVEVVGVYTHFATSDEYVYVQILRYNKLIKGLNLLRHADNSIVSELKNHSLDMVRMGYNIYNQDLYGYKPVVRIRSHIVQINKVKKGDLIGYDRRFIADNKMRIAIIPIGYADGLDMSYIGGTIKYKDGQCKILNICMDCFMLDVTNVETCVGDEIYILDRNNPLKKYAQILHSSSYEVMTKFGNMRAKRIVED